MLRRSAASGWKLPGGSGYTNGMSAKNPVLRRWTALLLRGLGVLALSLLLHLLALHWAGRHIGLPSSGSAEAPAVTVQLRPPLLRAQSRFRQSRPLAPPTDCR